MADKKPLTSFKVWSETFACMKQTSKSSFAVALFVFLLPMSFASIFFARLAQPAAINIRTLLESFGQQNTPLNYRMILEPILPFFSLYLVFHLIFILLALAGFFALVLIALSQLNCIQSKDKTPLDFFKSGLRLTFFKGLIILFGVSILSAEQFLLGPFRVFSLLALASVVLVIVEKKSGFAALWQALFLRYVSKVTGSGLSTFLIVLASAAMIYLFEASVAFIAQNILILDEWLNVSRDLWTYKLPGFPCSVVYLLTDLLSIAAYIFLVVFCAHFIACLYVNVCKKLSERT